METNVNAYYIELAAAEADLSAAQIRVDSLKAAIVARGGELPSPDETPEDVKKPAKKGKN